MKKILSALLAVAILLSMTVVAFAASNDVTFTLLGTSGDYNRKSEIWVDAVGDEVKVELKLSNKDGLTGDMNLYSVQDYVYFNPKYLEYEADKSTKLAGFSATLVSRSGEKNRVFVERTSSTALTVPNETIIATLYFKTLTDSTTQVDNVQPLKTDLDGGGSGYATGESLIIHIGEGTPTEYTVSFNANGHGTAPASQRVAISASEDDRKVTEPTAPTATGYIFGGWYKEEACTNKWNFSTDIVSKDMTLYAKWTEKSADSTKFTVTFNANGHGDSPDAQTVTNGSKLTEPTALTADGYTFGGWYEEAGCTNKWNFSTDTVSKDMTLYAKWTKNSTKTATVSFDKDGDSIPDSNTTVTVGNPVTKPTVSDVPSGYEIEGWYKDKEHTQPWDFSTPVTDDITLYANVEPKDTTTKDEATVRYFITSTTTPDATKQVKKNELLTKPATDPTKSGYTFGGWYTDKACTTAWNFASDKVTGDVNLYAKWKSTSASATVSYDKDGDSIPDSHETVKVGDKLTEPADTSPDGYEITGWYTDPEHTQPWDFDNDTVSDDTTLYAKVEPKDTAAADEATVRYFITSTTTPDATKQVKKNELLTKPATDPTKSGYKFGGWYTNSACTTAWNFASDKVTGDVDLYAKWTSNTTKKATVSYDNDGDSIPDNKETVNVGDGLKEPTVTPPSGYTIDGWYKDPEHTQPWDFDTDVVSDDTTLYAKVVPTDTTKDTATVGYYVTSTSKPDTTKKVYKNTVLTKPTTPTKSGYTFGGWYTDKECTAKYDFAAKVTDDINLYAKWTKDSSSTTPTSTTTSTTTTTPTTTPTTPSTVGNFSDVPSDAYYADAVKWAVNNGVTTGTDSTHFSPFDITTRAQMVTFLWRASGSPEPRTTTSPFVDVKPSDYYYKAVLWGYENVYVKGTSPTTFDGELTVTRGQAMAFIARLAGVADEATGYTHNFTDVKSTSYYNNAISWAASNNIAKGVTATTFAPDTGCKRGEVVTFLYRYFI